LLIREESVGRVRVEIVIERVSGTVVRIEHEWSQQLGAERLNALREKGGGQVLYFASVK